MSGDIKPEGIHLHCRCCLNRFAGGSINTSEMPRPLFQLFRYCTGFRMWQKGLYPEFICELCHELLLSFERFEKQCKQSSCILEDLLNGHRIDEETATTRKKNDEPTPPSKPNQVPLSDTKTSTSIPKPKDPTKDDSPFEKIDVKPEIENERDLIDNQHVDSELEDSLALAELDDAEVKSEASSISLDKSPKDEMISKKQNKYSLRCEICENIFTTSVKLKQHIKKVHKNRFLRTRNEILSTLKTTEFKRSTQNVEISLSHSDTKIPELPVDTMETPDATSPIDVIFENIVVKPKLEDAALEAQQYSDSDFEDSLALTELRKSTMKRKEKRTVNKKRKRSPSPLNSENETFGPLKQEKPKVECDKCPRKFKWPFELRRHIKEMHGDKPLELPCKYECGKIFNSQNTLKSHYRIKHQMKKQIYRENAYICEQCGKGFKRLPLLERHRFHHLPPEARPYKCEQCGKTFVMERIYKEHLLRHSGNKKYECSYCGIKKATLGEYREHINIHTKEKEYACELCPKIFYRSKNLVQHVSAVHQGIKKHFCRFCQHSFANHINLVHHERIHTGEKPYSCEICKRSFIQPSALKTHMKTHDDTRIKAKVGRKPKNNKAKEEFDFEAIMNDNVQQQINNYHE